MAMKNWLVTERPNGSMSVPTEYPRGLLDTLIAVRLGLKHVVVEGDGCPVEVSSNLRRMFDDLDTSIDKLVGLIQKPSLTIQIRQS